MFFSISKVESVESTWSSNGTNQIKNTGLDNCKSKGMGLQNMCSYWLNFFSGYFFCFEPSLQHRELRTIRDTAHLKKAKEVAKEIWEDLGILDS